MSAPPPAPSVFPCGICRDETPANQLRADAALRCVVCPDCRQGIRCGLAIFARLGVSGVTRDPSLPDNRLDH